MTRAMRSLELDFKRRRRTAPWAGWVLLALAAAFTVDLGVSYSDARASLTTAEARIARLVHAGGTMNAGLRRQPVTKEEVTAARETYHRLAMPWAQLFAALESAASEKVALLSIEPDAKSGTVTISGEGRDYPAVLDYIEQLRAAPALTSAHLVKHESKQGAAQPVVAFSVAATWGEVKR